MSSATEVTGIANTGLNGGIVPIGHFRFVNVGEEIVSADTYGISGNIEYKSSNYLVVKLKSIYKGEVFNYETVCRITIGKIINSAPKTYYTFLDPNNYDIIKSRVCVDGTEGVSVFILKILDTMSLTITQLYRESAPLAVKVNVIWSLEPELKQASSEKQQVNQLLLDNLSYSPTPKLRIIWTTDELGANLSEIICLVEGNYLQKDKYPIKLIGKYTWFCLYKTNMSYFSKHPNLMSVMIGKPARTYLQKSQKLNKNVMDIGFYVNLLSFMSLRYFLGGLTSGILTKKWLLQSKTKDFYSNLAKSEFAIYITLFTETYKGYDLYMRKHC